MTTRAELRASVERAIHRVAPEADLAALPGDVDLRDELDIDSMDFLNLVTVLHQELAVPIPEKDYPKLATLDGAVGYLAESLGVSV